MTSTSSHPSCRCRQVVLLHGRGEPQQNISIIMCIIEDVAIEFDEDEDEDEQAYDRHEDEDDDSTALEKVQDKGQGDLNADTNHGKGHAKDTNPARRVSQDRSSNRKRNSVSFDAFSRLPVLPAHDTKRQRVTEPMVTPSTWRNPTITTAPHVHGPDTFPQSIAVQSDDSLLDSWREERGPQLLGLDEDLDWFDLRSLSTATDGQGRDMHELPTKLPDGAFDMVKFRNNTAPPIHLHVIFAGACVPTDPKAFPMGERTRKSRMLPLQALRKVSTLLPRSRCSDL